MIGYVRGIVTHLLADCCYVDVHGVGYRVYVSGATQYELTEGTEVTLFTYTNVREDAIQLYGFRSLAEYELFILLISVSGIGPKVGLGMLSGMSPEGLKQAIANGQVATLVKLPGIGKKTAERIVLELKDKITKLGAIPTAVNPISMVEVIPVGAVEEVIAGLTGLGYAEAEVRPLVENLNDGKKSVPVLLKETLAELGKGRK